MLVLKRALSFILSFVLVFAPSLAWARKDQKNRAKKHFQAENPDVYQRQQTRLEAKAARKQARLEQTKRRSGSVAKQEKFKSADAAINSVYRPVKFKGQDYTITQLPGVGKRAKVQMIKGKDFEEILVDEHGTGTASVWQVTRGDLQMKASHPFNGSFSQIDIRERRAKSYVNAHLQLNPDFKTYRVANYSVEPFHVDHDYSEVVIACPNQLNDTVSLDGMANLKKLLDSITAEGMTPDAALACKLNHYQEALFDKSCYKDKFAGSASDMAAGVAKIFASVGEHAPTGQPRYLQCLNEYGFAYNSAQMQANFVHNKANATLGVQYATRRPSDVAAADAKSCSTLDQVDIYSGSQKTGSDSLLNLTPLSGTFKPFTCNAALPTDGEFQDNTSQQIELGWNSSEMVNGGYQNAIDGYASVIFHEMLHQTGLSEANSEGLVENLQSCCADPNPNSSASTKACGAIKTYTAQQLNRQNNENKLSMFMPGYAEMRLHAVAVLGGTKTDEFLGDWYAGLESDPKASKAWAQLQKCDQANAADITSCNAAAEKTLQTYTDAFVAARQKKDGFNYSSLKAQFDSDLKTGSQAKAQGVPTLLPGGTVVVVPGTESQHDLKSLLDQVPTINGLVEPTTIAKPLAVNSNPNNTTVAEVVVTASPKSQPSAKVANTTDLSKQVGSGKPQPTSQSGTAPEVIEVDRGGGTAQASAPAKQAGTDAPAAAKASAGGDSSTLAPSSASAPVDASGAAPTAASVPTSYVSPTATRAAAPTPSIVSSPKSMPLSIDGSVPASSPEGQKLDPGTSNSIATAEAVTKTFASVGQGLISSFTNSVSGTALASQVAAARQPASASNQTQSSGSRVSSSSPNKGADGSGPPSKTKSKSSGSDDPSLVGDGDSKAKEDDSIDPKAAVSIANFETLKSARADVVWRHLLDFDPATLIRELNRGESSGVVRTLKANGWTVLQKGRSLILASPGRKKCFTPDLQRKLISLPSCG